MKLASLDGKRVEPSKGTNATCPHCEQPVTAKCGKIRVHHWAHKSNRHCDSWWEPETEWHRKWKNEFPFEWQEIGRRDERGELHIADVLTDTGLVLEFQHSPISRDEVEARNAFHQNICWVVNAGRLESSLTQFSDALAYGRKLRSSNGTVVQIWLRRSRLLRHWSGLSAPIVLDFGFDQLWVVGQSIDDTVLVYPWLRKIVVEQFKLGHRPPSVTITRFGSLIKRGLW